MKILLLSKIFGDSIDRLRQRHDVIAGFDKSADELGELIGDREALVFRSGVDVTADLMSRAPDLRGIPVRLTRAGHQLFYGELDWVEANGVDRWLGGVHLNGMTPWRWDEAKGRLVDSPGA